MNAKAFLHGRQGRAESTHFRRIVCRMSSKRERIRLGDFLDFKDAGENAPGDLPLHRKLKSSLKLKSSRINHTAKADD